MNESNETYTDLFHSYFFKSKEYEYLFTHNELGFILEKRIGNEDKWQIISTNIKEFEND